MKSAVCPSCDAEIEIGATPSFDLRLECPVCDAALKIIWLDPVELDWWDFDDDEENEHIDNDLEEEDDLADFDERAFISVLDHDDAESLDEISMATFPGAYDDAGDGEDAGEEYREDRELLDN